MKFLTQQTSKHTGFSMMEIIVVLGIMSVLAATVAPLALKRIEASRMSRAQSDLRSIETAITNFRKDTKEYPGRRIAWPSASSGLWLLYSAGKRPTADLSAGIYRQEDGSIHTEELAFFLMENGGNRYRSWDPKLQIGWNGPYLTKDPTDPWGYRYLVNSAGLKLHVPASPTPAGCGSDPYCTAWVLSPGPDNHVSTNDAGLTLGGDDIGIRMRSQYDGI